jgi:hypothetical protein
MTRFVPAAVLAASLCLAAGCKRQDAVKLQQTEEEPARLASIVHVADPRVSAQLLSGFHEIEQNSWRWTAGKFAVLLRTPRYAAERGAVLQLKFSVPDAIIDRLKTISLNAAVNESELSPETYTQAGEFTYSRDVPAKLLSGDSVKVEFFLDKSLPPGAGDLRELGVVVTSAGLESKPAGG